MTNGRKFGYARVSTSQQSLDLQKSELLNAGVREDRFFSDTINRYRLPLAVAESPKSINRLR